MVCSVDAEGVEFFVVSGPSCIAHQSKSVHMHHFRFRKRSFYFIGRGYSNPRQ